MACEEEGSEEASRQELDWVNQPQRALLRLSWPMAVSMFSYSLMTLVDTLFVGHLGSSALAGVGLGGMAAFTVLSFPFGLLSGVKIRVSHAVGARRRADADTFARAGLVIALCCSLVSIAVGQVVAIFLPALSTTQAAGAAAESYLTIRLLGAPAAMAAIALREYRYGLSDSRSPMIAMLAANVVNMGLDYVFIFEFEWGVAGAAAASAIASLTSLAILLQVVPRRVLALVRVSMEHVRSVWEVGAPSGVQFFLEVGSFAMLAALVSSFGELQMAAHQVALQVVHFTFLPLIAVSEAASVLAGQAVGADRRDLVRPVAHRALAMAGIYAIACTVGLVSFGDLIATAFGDDLTLQATVTHLLYVAAVFQIFDAGNVIARGVLRGTGDVRFAAMIGIGCAWVFAPPLTYLLGGTLGLGAVGAWIALCFEISIGAGLFWLRLERRFRTPAATTSATGRARLALKRSGA